MKEGELDFDFTAAKSAEKLDDPLKKKPEGMMLVDFVVEEENRLIMIEIKDPSAKAKGSDQNAENALQQNRIGYIRDLQNDTLIAEKLTPKARDSYCYLHLMHRDTKPILYVFLLGVDNLPIDQHLLLSVKDRLLSKLEKEADQPWKRRYVSDCLVLTEQTWSSTFPEYPLIRV
jgi:hypothetical protein